jgi:hypothetical protein
VNIQTQWVITPGKQTTNNINLFFNNQPEGLISQIYSVIKIYMFRASPLPLIMNCIQAESGCFIMTLLGYGNQKPARNLPVPNVQWNTHDDGQRKCPKHVEFYDRINLVN